MRYVHWLPASASFKDTGLTGYIFGPLNDPNVEVCYIDVVQGHDTFQISRKITRIYYVLTGSGYFDNRRAAIRSHLGCADRSPTRIGILLLGSNETYCVYETALVRRQ